MKLFVFISLCVAVAVAKPSALLYAAAPSFSPIAPIATAPLISQYHSQDELGQYSYGYSGGLSAKTETKSLDGVTRGAYSYIDAEGKLQSVEYTADAVNGFRAAATNLPVAPVDDRVAPEPVQETPEVAQARADHMMAFKEAESRAAESTPAMPEAPIAAPIVSGAQFAPAGPFYFRASETIAPKPIAYSYGYAAPGFAYSTFNAYPYFGYNAPLIARAAPFPYVPYYNANPVVDTPEVAKAKAEHFAAVEEAKARM